MDDSDLAVLLLAAWALGGASSELRRWIDPALPTGARHPGLGPLREIAPVRTRLDPQGFPELYAQAIAIVDSWGHALQASLSHWLTEHHDVRPVDADLLPAGRVYGAQAILETDHGRATWHYNLGNLHASAGDYYRLPGAPGERFAAWLYPLQAAVGHVARVRRLWPHAHHAALEGPGSVDIFARALATGRVRYYTANPDAYARAMRSILDRYGWA